MIQILVISNFLDNGFEATLRSKTNVLIVWKEQFPFFANFWVTTLKPFSGKARQRFQNYLNQNLVIGRFLENGFHATLSSKTNVLRVWKGHFIFFFPNFWVTKLQPFSGKLRQSVQNYLNQNLVIGTFLENGFKATLSSKTNVFSVWKGHFSVFCQFLSGEVETIFWESETKHSKLFKSKNSHKKLLRKWFWSYVQLKNEYSEHMKRAFFSFFEIFEWRSWNRFLGKWGKAFKII